MTWVYAARLDDVWEGELCAVRLGAVDVLLCNVEGEVVAYQDRCPHLANPLSCGLLQERQLTCAAHEWVFDVLTGQGVNPSNASLRRYPVRVAGEQIFVSLEDNDERDRWGRPERRSGTAGDTVRTVDRVGHRE